MINIGLITYQYIQLEIFNSINIRVQYCRREYLTPYIGRVSLLYTVYISLYRVYLVNTVLQGCPDVPK